MSTNESTPACPEWCGKGRSWLPKGAAAYHRKGRVYHRKRCLLAAAKDEKASPTPAVTGVPTARPEPFTEEQVMRWHDASGTGPYWRTHARDIAEMLNARDRATALRHAEELARVRREVDGLKRQLTFQRENNHERNVELDSLHYVWCNGGCKGGVHRFTPGEVTEEVVQAAERNTARLRQWWENKKFRDARSLSIPGGAELGTKEGSRG